MARTRIKAPQIDTGSQGAGASGAVSTTSTSYVSLSGDPAVTVVVPASGKLQICISALIYTSAGVPDAYMSFALSGANTVAGTDAQSISNKQVSGISVGACFILTGLTPGSTVVTAQYRQSISGQTGNFLNRNISAEPK